MRKLLLALLIIASALVYSATGQVPTQEQLLEANTQLNQAYQQLRGSLNDEQKYELVSAQRQWVKKRDAFVAANPRNPQGSYYQETTKRALDLRRLISQKVQTKRDDGELENRLVLETVMQTADSSAKVIADNEKLVVKLSADHNYYLIHRKTGIMLSSGTLSAMAIKGAVLSSNSRYLAVHVHNPAGAGISFKIFDLSSGSAVMVSEHIPTFKNSVESIGIENNCNLIFACGEYYFTIPLLNDWEEPHITQLNDSIIFNKKTRLSVGNEKKDLSLKTKDASGFWSSAEFLDPHSISLSSGYLDEQKTYPFSSPPLWAWTNANFTKSIKLDLLSLQFSETIPNRILVNKSSSRSAKEIYQNDGYDEYGDMIKSFLIKGDTEVTHFDFQGHKGNSASPSPYLIKNRNNYQVALFMPEHSISYDMAENPPFLPKTSTQLNEYIHIESNEVAFGIYDSNLLLFKDNNKLFFLDNDLKIIKTIPWNGEFEYISVAPNKEFALGVKRVGKNSPNYIQVFNCINHRVVGNLIASEDGVALVDTNNGFYMARGKISSLLGFKDKLDAYPFEQFDLRLNRPDIFIEALGAPADAVRIARELRDKRLKRMGVTEEMLKPDFHLPELQIIGEVPASTSKGQLDLQIMAIDDKYTLDRLRVYVNNVPVNGRDGELLRDQKTQSLEKTIPIKLASGRNKIQVSVLNSAGAESLYANAEVTCSAERPKPKLYAVAMGVSQYDRPEWCLKYAAKDATDLIGKLKAKAGSSYSEVKQLLLTDKEVTKESAAKIKEFLSGATIDDTVLIFMAGHGLLDDKYDYYFGTTDIDPGKPSERGMPYEAIDNILAEVPSLKKALLMDTCHAGELDDDEKKELSTSDGSATPAGIPAAATNSSPMAGKVAMRSIGTRGMTVKAVEGAKGKSDWYEKLQDMFVDLRRGSGATVISSSQGAEYAFESSEQSNGLFTYALMEALDGKATPNKEGQITISTIGDYVKKRVQDLTKGKQNPNLRGVNLEEDFVLGTAK